LPFDIFYILMEKLTFNEVIPLRRVCFQWREWIDEYLKKQRTIEIYPRDKPKFKFQPLLAGISLTMGLDMNRIFSKRLVLSPAKMSERSFPESITRMFPNITELFLHSRRIISPHIAYAMHRRLFHYWRDIETLFFTPGEDKSGVNLVKLLNELESLTVLMMEGDNSFCIGRYQDKFFYLEEPFMKRLKALSVPSIHWIRSLEDVSHINNFATISGNVIIHEKLEKLFIKTELWIDSRQNSTNSIVINLLDDLAKRCPKIRALEFTFPYSLTFRVGVCSLFNCKQFIY